MNKIKIGKNEQREKSYCSTYRRTTARMFRARVSPIRSKVLRSGRPFFETVAERLQVYPTADFFTFILRLRFGISDTLFSLQRLLKG